MDSLALGLLAGLGATYVPESLVVQIVAPTHHVRPHPILSVATFIEWLIPARHAAKLDPLQALNGNH